MKILTVHNMYQLPGGEDTVLATESRLLESNGHGVFHFGRDNEQLNGGSGIAKLAAAAGAIWSISNHAAMLEILKIHKPDITHFHNIFPLISPSAYYACEEAGVPVVQTLHNYRLLCPGATFMRDGKVCELCLDRAVPWPGVLHSCYRDSRPASLATVSMLAVHRGLRTWQKKVDVYIALSEFARRKFIAGGIPAERIVVKPNFIFHPPEPRPSLGQHALYVGRLSEEKGLRVLLLAAKKFSNSTHLKVAGDGPLFDELKRDAGVANQPTTKLLGRCAKEQVAELIASARFQIVPSIWYEGFPMVVLEAFSSGIPVIASRLGSLAEIVDDGRTGLLFRPGDPDDLAAKVNWAWSNPEAMCEMGRAARREYESKYTAEHNYRMLMDIYRRAISSRAPQKLSQVEDRGLVKD